MKVRWNPHEIVKVDIGEDPDDYVMELYRGDGSELTVKSTQFQSGELFVKANGKPAGTNEPTLLVIGDYAIRVLSYENDDIAPVSVTILSHELKGKSLRLKVDICS